MKRIAPVATLTHAAFHRLLAEQGWPFWAIDSSALEPLVAYHAVSLSTLIRVVKSHYTYSDVYLFCHASSEVEIAAIDWCAIPSLDDQDAKAYIITQAVGQPFLGFAGSLDAAQRGDILLLLPAITEGI